MTDTAPTAESSPTPTATATLVARRSRHFTVTKVLLIPLGCLAMGGWFLKDGFHSWPAANAEYRARHPDAGVLPHRDFDIQLQKILGFVLLPAGVAAFAYFMYRSRGAYEYDGQALRVPGHPPVPNAAMQTLDRAKWDRKGIAYLAYELPGRPPGRLTIDGYIYEQGPTDRIFAGIEALFTPPAAAATGDAADPAADGGTATIADV